MLTAPNTGSPLDVLVMAEQSNTNNIAAVTTVTIPTGSTLAAFSLLVPTTNTIPTLDLFASVQDQFGGVPQQATGHSIAVMQGVPSPPAASACMTPVTLATLGPMTCEGHGSLSGTASTFDRNTTIILSKDGVQLMQSKVDAGGVFNFCAPADPAAGYAVQHFENVTPFEGGMSVGPPTMFILTAPSLIPTPCSSICNTGTPATCFLCANTPGIVVP
jgi:hypothetical protein